MHILPKGGLRHLSEPADQWVSISPTPPAYTNMSSVSITKDGGYAEYCMLWANAAVRLPPDIDPVEAAPLLCAGVTTHRGLLGIGAKPGSVVAVQGIGGLG